MVTVRIEITVRLFLRYAGSPTLYAMMLQSTHNRHFLVNVTSL